VKGTVTNDMMHAAFYVHSTLSEPPENPVLPCGLSEIVLMVIISSFCVESCCAFYHCSAPFHVASGDRGLKL
jgi:hypothetical protein